jgi:hypothetical protein
MEKARRLAGERTGIAPLVSPPDNIYPVESL